MEKVKKKQIRKTKLERMMKQCPFSSDDNGSQQNNSNQIMINQPFPPFDSSVNMVQNNSSPQIGLTVPICYKEPVITEDMENSEEEEEEEEPAVLGGGGGLPDIKNLGEKTFTGPCASILCRSLRIGSYKVLKPPENLIFVPRGIKIKIPSISEGDEKDMVTIDIPITKIVKILAHFDRSLPVIFVYVKPSMGRTIRKALKMTDESGFYFDPCSLDESQKRITILPERYMDEKGITIFKMLFKSMSKSTTIDASSTKGLENRNLSGQSQAPSSISSYCILDELDLKEANEILIRSSLQDSTYTYKPGAYKKPKEKEKKSPGVPSQKRKIRKRGRGRAYDEPVRILISSISNNKKTEVQNNNNQLINHISHINIKEPVITPDMDNNEDYEVDKGAAMLGGDLPGFKDLEERILKVPYTSLWCRSLRIGSYKVLMPTERVIFVPEGIRIKIPSILRGDEKEMVTIDIPITKVVKILAHFGNSVPVFFVYVRPSMGISIRHTLKMTDPLGLYFDPCSSDESQKRIAILPDKFMENCRSIFKELFKLESKSVTIGISSTMSPVKRNLTGSRIIFKELSKSESESTTTGASSSMGIVNRNLTAQSQASSSTSSHCILVELDQKEANEILIRSAPKETLSNRNMAKKRKTEESHISTIMKQVPILNLRKILPKNSSNEKKYIHVVTDEKYENQKNKKKLRKKRDNKYEQSDNKQNQTMNTSPSQIPIFFSIQPINNCGQIVFQPNQNLQQKGNVLTPNENDKGVKQILPINQEKVDDGNIQLAPNTNPVLVLPPVVFEPNQNLQQKGNVLTPNKNDTEVKQILPINEEKVDDGNTQLAPTTSPVLMLPPVVMLQFLQLKPCQVMPNPEEGDVNSGQSNAVSCKRDANNPEEEDVASGDEIESGDEKTGNISSSVSTTAAVSAAKKIETQAQSSHNSSDKIPSADNLNKNTPQTSASANSLTSNTSNLKPGPDEQPFLSSNPNSNLSINSNNNFDDTSVENATNAKESETQAQSCHNSTDKTHSADNLSQLLVHLSDMPTSNTINLNPDPEEQLIASNPYSNIRINLKNTSDHTTEKQASAVKETETQALSHHNAT